MLERREHVWTPAFEYSQLLKLRALLGLPKADRERVMGVADEINRLMVENATVFESKIYEGVSQVYTHASALEIISRQATDEKVKQRALECLERQKKVDRGVDQNVFALCSSTPNPVAKTDGGFSTAQDVGNMQILRHLGDVMRQLTDEAYTGEIKDFTVVFLGCPFNPGAKTTEVFNQALASDAFLALGELNAELIMAKYPDLEKLSLVGGVSFGAVVAMKAANFFSDRIRALMRVLVANPDPKYGPDTKHKGNGLTMMLGLSTEMGDLVNRWPNYFVGKMVIAGEYNRVLQQMAKRREPVEIEDSKEQKDLKKAGWITIAAEMVKGADREKSPLIPKGAIKVEIIQGAIDRTSQSFGEMANALVKLFEMGKEEIIEKKKQPLLGLGVHTDETGRVREWRIRAGHPLDMQKKKKWDLLTRCLNWKCKQAVVAAAA